MVARDRSDPCLRWQRGCTESHRCRRRPREGAESHRCRRWPREGAEGHRGRRWRRGSAESHGIGRYRRWARGCAKSLGRNQAAGSTSGPPPPLQRGPPRRSGLARRSSRVRFAPLLFFFCSSFRSLTAGTRPIFSSIYCRRLLPPLLCTAACHVTCPFTLGAGTWAIQRNSASWYRLFHPAIAENMRRGAGLTAQQLP